MNHNEPTDAQLEDLLGTYAEALYQRSIVPDSKEETQATDGLAVSNTNQKANTMNTNDEQAALEVDLQPANNGGSSKGKVLALAGAFVLAAAVGIGAVALISNNDGSELDLAEDAAEEEVTEDQTGASEETVPETTVPEGELNNAATSGVVDDVVTESSFFDPFGGGTTVFADGEFATLSNEGLDGYVLRRGIGDESTATSTTGLPNADSYVSHVVQTDSGFAALFEVFPELNEAEAEEFGPFSQGQSTTYVLATSTDMVDWTSVELPALVDSNDVSVFINALAASGDRILIAGQVNNFAIPEQILLESGRISEEDVFNICSTQFDGSTYSVYTCDFDNQVDFEEELDETLLISINEADEIFEEIVAANDAQNEAETVFAVGPIDGPFEVVDGPVDGFDVTLAGTSAGFMTVGSTNEGISQAFASTDGLTWNEISTPLGANNVFAFSSLSANGDSIVATTQGQDGLVTSVTSDLGQTWTEGVINTELFFAYGEVISGPAGFAVQLQGGVEPFDTGFDEDRIELTKDGYTMTIGFFDGMASLVGPDGAFIYEEVSLLLAENGIEGVVRFEGPADEDLIWLDPVTGEDLITFSESDFEAAYPEPTFEENFEEPDQATELWFSTDGLTWTLLETGEPSFGSYSAVFGVGDDEVVTLTQVFTEPPAELLDFENEFEPTEEEEAALDAWFSENGDQSTFKVIPIG